MKICPCGKEITRNQYCAENERQWTKREASGYCRPKCSRTFKPSPSPRDRPALVADPTAWNLERPEGKEQPKEKHIVDVSYEAWIRSFPCLVPGCHGQAQSHHQNEKGKSGMATKTDSYRCLPLCYWHHTQGGTENAPGSYHGMGKLTGWKFWKAYGVDVETVIHDLNRAWLEMGRKFKEG